MEYLVKITITLKQGVLDTQGKAVTASLHGMGGYEALQEVRVGRFLELRLSAKDRGTALTLAEGMCGDLLVNDLIEERSIEVVEIR